MTIQGSLRSGSVPVERAVAEPVLRAWQPGRLQPLGYRVMLLHEPARSMVANGEVEWLWRAAADMGLPMTMLATDSLAALAGVAARYPSLKLTIDHLGGRGGLTTLKDDEAMTHMPQLLVGPVSEYRREGDRRSRLLQGTYPFARCTAIAPDPQRVWSGAHVWGTDISKMPCSWRECVTMFTEQLDWLSAGDLQLIMGDAICRWWGWQR